MDLLKFSDHPQAFPVIPTGGARIVEAILSMENWREAYLIIYRVSTLFRSARDFSAFSFAMRHNLAL
jgi:hypothetical protein